MMQPQTWPILVLLPLCFVAGVILGLAYFRCVKVTADLIVTGKRPFFVAGLAVGRLVLLAAGLTLSLQGGGFGLLGTLAGVVAGRELMIRSKWGART